MDYHNSHHRRHRIGPHISIPTPRFYEVSHYSANQTPKSTPMEEVPKLPPRNEASMVMPVIDSYEINVGNVESTIHTIELEAYATVLKAFKAQSDLLSWGKEGVITELRRELNVTDEEHRELLMRVNSDKSIKMIRELQQRTVHRRDLPSGVTYTPGFGPNSVGCFPSQNNLKLASIEAPTIQKFTAHGQPSPVQTPPPQLQNWDDSGNGGLSACYARCPEQPMRVVVPSVTKPSETKYRSPLPPQPKNPVHVAEVHNVKKKSRIIKLCATETVLSKVQNMVYGKENPSQDQVEKAKSILLGQEKAILDALAELADVTEEGDSPKGYQDQSRRELTMMGGRNSQEYLC